MATYTTLETAMAAYRENTDYEEENSIAKVKIVIGACRSIISFLAEGMESQVGEERFIDAPNFFQEQLEQARAWWMSNDSAATGVSGRTVTVDLSEFRR